MDYREARRGVLTWLRRPPVQAEQDVIRQAYPVFASSLLTSIEGALRLALGSRPESTIGYLRKIDKALRELRDIQGIDVHERFALRAEVWSTVLPDSQLLRQALDDLFAQLSRVLKNSLYRDPSHSPSRFIDTALITPRHIQAILRKSKENEEKRVLTVALREILPFCLRIPGQGRAHSLETFATTLSRHLLEKPLDEVDRHLQGFTYNACKLSERERESVLDTVRSKLVSKTRFACEAMLDRLHIELPLRARLLRDDSDSWDREQNTLTELIRDQLPDRVQNCFQAVRDAAAKHVRPALFSEAFTAARVSVTPRPLQQLAIDFQRHYR
ncbi:MAG: hypothetical protein KatS3mg015_1237 [Fimbriimonadales bacterium]|nr:MAG: hypothetical protein KatS3mg015_1237 [Fimbriimonadales bacterium]